MHIAICNSNYLANHASAHTRAILSHSNSRAAVALSVESIVTAAVSQLHYTRSVAIVSKQIMNRLKCEAGPQLAHKFTECLVDAVGGVFFAYWRVSIELPGPYLLLKLFTWLLGAHKPSCTGIRS